MNKINVEILSRQDIEEISYMTSYLINKSWTRTYLSADSLERNFNLFAEQNYAWEKGGVTRSIWATSYSYKFEDRWVETKYFTLEEAFNHQCCLDDGAKK